MVIDVVGNQLDARMIGVTGNVLDHFRIVKGAALPACSDGVDQDGDGRFDFPQDPGCASAAAAFEDPACDNGADDDGDGLADFPDDPGCGLAAGARENPQCDDDLDNDSDGAVDWDGGPLGKPIDAQCTAAPSADSETPACGLGVELAIVLALLARGQGPRRTR
jgi:hypothetical protein